MQDDGFVAQLLVGDGTKDIKVNTPLAVIVEDKVRPGSALLLYGAVSSCDLFHQLESNHKRPRGAWRAPQATSGTQSAFRMLAPVEDVAIAVLCSCVDLPQRREPT